MNDLKIQGINISSPERIIFKKENISKLDVVKYYEMVAPLMLPFIEKRPLSVIRCHGDTCFFKKHPNTSSKHIKTFKKNDEEYFYVTTTKGIILEVQNGTIEFHTGGSKYPKLDKPNYMVFDLDPDKKLHINTLRQGVFYLKEILDKLNLKSFLKTSGGKGYHVVVPFCTSKNWNNFSTFSKQIAQLLESQYPKLYTANIRKSNRNGKIFIDYLRNDKGATCVSPYSLRARAGAPISMPISWDELNKIAPDEITLTSAAKKLKNKNPWKDFFM